MAITILNDKLYAGQEFKSFSELCQEIVLINGINCKKGKSIGSYKSSIEKELQKYAEISIQQAVKNGNKTITIKDVFSEKKAPPVGTVKDKKNIADYMRPIFYEMINREYQDVCLIKYHKALTVEAGYMPSEYGELYKNVKRNKKFFLRGIKNDENYSKYIIEKLITKIKGHIKTCCDNLKYENVSTYKMPMNMEDYDFLDCADQILYDNFKKKAKDDIDKVREKLKAENPNKKIYMNYQSIPYTANYKFNEYKKELNPEYDPINLSEAWIFEIDGDFKPIQQTTNPIYLNNEIIQGFSNLIRYDALCNYTQTQEYKELMSNKDHFRAKNGFICSDKEVRQALTKKNRDNTAEAKGIDEKEIGLDFSILYIESYLSDIEIIIDACEL